MIARHTSQLAKTSDKWKPMFVNVEVNPTTEPTKIWAPTHGRWAGMMEVKTSVQVYHQIDTQVLEMLDGLRDEVQAIRELLESHLDTSDEPDNSDMSVEEVKELILAEVELDRPFYPSDLAEEYGLDLNATLEAVDMLRKEGRIKDKK